MKPSVPQFGGWQQTIVKLTLGTISANWNLSQICWNGGIVACLGTTSSDVFPCKPFLSPTTQYLHCISSSQMMPLGGER
jgi:hypothetical protein